MESIIQQLAIQFIISLITSLIIAPLFINLMYKFNQTVKVTKIKLKGAVGDNSLFNKIMNTQKTNGTPNMGGILILFIVPLLYLFIMDKSLLLNYIILGFIILGIWGLLDVLFTNAIKNNPELRAQQETFGWRLTKLIISICINLIIVYFIMKNSTINSIELISNIKIEYSIWLIVPIAIIGQFAVYAGELTDGLDGHLMGIYQIVLTALGFILLLQENYTFLPLITITLGVVSTDLYFNIPPARFWNGGPGAMPIAFLLFIVSLLTNNLIPYFIMTLIMWLTLLSSMIQILSFKLFKRRVFKIAPIHHHFQAIGWPKEKITMRFWLFTFILSIIAILVSTII